MEQVFGSNSVGIDIDKVRIEIDIEFLCVLDLDGQHFH